MYGEDCGKTFSMYLVLTRRDRCGPRRGHIDGWKKAVKRECWNIRTRSFVSAPVFTSAESPRAVLALVLPLWCEEGLSRGRR